MRNHKQKAVSQVTSFAHKGGYILDVFFADKTHRVINFEPVFKQLQGYYAKWYKPQNFKKVFVEHGNLSWGKNADVIFGLDKIYTGEVEYIILP